MKKCNRCGEVEEIIKTKVFSGKEYPDICETCYDEINEENTSRLCNLEKRLKSRRNFINHIEHSNIPQRFKYSSFSDFKDTGDNIKKFNGLRTTEEPVFIWGEQSGNGKTHLAIALLKTMLWRGYDIEYITAPMLMVLLRGSFSNDNSSEISIINEYTNVDALLIDDIGVEKNTDYCMQCWYTIINNRYNDCKPTIFTSNYSLKILSEKLGNRIISRIASGRVIKITGKDYRLNK